MSKATVERLATAAPVPLRAVYETARRLDELSTARIIGDIAEALHKAQTGGKPVHRLTPDAIVIAPSGEPALSLPAGPEASLAYASPERIKGMTGDRRSDVFSLGVVLWEALAHTRLFEGTDEAIKRAVLERDIRPPSEKNANVPAELDAICKKALARDPADRYQSAKVMAAEIAAVLDDAGYPDDHSRIAKFLSELPTSAKSTMPGIGPKADAAKPSDKQGSAKSPAGAPAERAKSPTSQPVADRAKSPTSQPLGARAKSPTSQPGDRAKSPTSPGSLAERLAAATPGRAKTPTTEPTTAAAAAAPTALTSPPAPADDPSKTAILGSGNPDVPAVPAAPLVPAAPIVAKAPLPAPARARSASRPPPTEPTVAASPEILPAAGSQPTPAPAAAPTPLVRVGSAPVAASPAPTQNGAVATPVDAAGSGATKAADLPEAANAVSLPRAQTKGDVLQGWGWGTDSHTAINPIEDDDDESTYAAERAKQRKRLFMAIGGVLGAIVLVALIALAFGGGGNTADDKEKAAKPSSGAVPATEPQPEPAVTQTEPAKVEEPKPEEPKPAEPAPAPEPTTDVAKTEPPKPEPPKKEEPKKEAPKKDPPKKEVAKKDPPKKEVAKKDPPKKAPAPKKEVAKKDPKPVDPYAATKVDAATAYRTGLQQFAKGDNKGALETFRTSLTTNQNHAPTWRGIGLVYEKLGKKAQAKIAFRKYLELSPKASDADQIRERMGRL